MNILKQSAIALTACVMSSGVVFAVPQAVNAQDYASFTLAPGFQPDPVVGTGASGGTHAVTCDTRSTGEGTSVTTYVDAADSPDHVLTVTRPFSFLRASVQAEGDVTLLVSGPDGTYCSDDVNGAMPEIHGSWPAGTYYFWIGDFAGPTSGTYRYQLQLSEY